MDAQQFLVNFRHIANAPGGIARLRDMVLALAVQGVLVSQDESEEPAAKQLERINVAASIRPTAGRRKRSASLDLSPLPELPHGWCAVRLCELVRVLNGRAFSKQELLESGTPVMRVGNLFTSNHWYYSNLELEADKYCEEGDLLYAWSASFGPFIWQGHRVIYHYHIWKLDLFDGTEVDKRFLYTWLLEKTREIKAAGHGISMAHMTKEKFEQLVVALPPLKEQSRIVAKVDELMALCDLLEAQQQDRRNLQNALRQSTLQALASAQSPHELQEGWQRLQKNFGRLFSEPEDVKELRLVLMELAIQGLLTEQLGDDGNAEELSFAAQVVDAVSTRGGKKALRSHDAVADSVPPFILPRNWTWTRLADVGYFLGGGTPSKSNPEYWQGSIPWVSPKDMKVTRISSAQDQISEKALVESAAKLIPTGSLLVVVRGMILAHSFPVGLTSREVAINQDMKALCPHRKDMGEFLLLLLAGSKRRFLELVERSTHGTCRLETDRFTSCVVGIPPLSEQARIVETVNKLMRNCDALQSQFAEMRKCLANVANAAVASLTGVTIEQVEKATVKAPQTELIASLRLGTSPDVKALAPLATLLARHKGEMSAHDLWQRFGGDIEAFYAQLKNEVAHGWIAEPEVAEVREKTIEAAEG